MPSYTINVTNTIVKKAALLPQLFRNHIPGHATRAPQVEFELAIHLHTFW